MAGGSDNDTLHGGEDQDALYGNWGNDYLYGNNGDDLLSGGEGDDVMTGGGDSDTFVFSGINISTSLFYSISFDFSSSQTPSTDTTFDVSKTAVASPEAIVVSTTELDPVNDIEKTAEEFLNEAEFKADDQDEKWVDSLLELPEDWLDEESPDQLTNTAVKPQDVSVSSDVMLTPTESNTSSYYFWNWGSYDIITDFEVGVDQIAFQGVGSIDGSTWLNQMKSQGLLTNTANGALFDFIDGNQLLLTGVNINDLSGSDFTFS
jgi:Ca2+-binding RTX toxin-like protein